jgi:hypothetical protein
MASAKLTKALAEQRIVLKKAPRIQGEVVLAFRPMLNKRTGKMEQPASIAIGWRSVNPLARTGVTIDNVRNSNLQDLVRRGAVVLE